MISEEPNDDVAQSQAVQETDDEENLMAISIQAVTRAEFHSTIRLQAWLQNHQILTLVDSRSTNSFINADLAAKLNGLYPLDKSINFRVADGGILQCSLKCIVACGGLRVTLSVQI